MAGIALRNEQERVTGHHDRGQRQFGDTRTQTREGFLERLPPSDRKHRNFGHFRLSKREERGGACVVQDGRMCGLLEDFTRPGKGAVSVV